MNTTETMDEVEENVPVKPGEQLARMRLENDLSTDYVATKLHLRVRLIELLEADDYENMPEPVFIRGYLRAYAKLLDADVEPLMDSFNRLCKTEQKYEKALWQARRQSNKAEHLVKWLSVVLGGIVILAVSMIWHKNKDSQALFSSNETSQESELNKSESEIRLTDLSKMRSLLSSNTQYTTMEKPGE